MTFRDDGASFETPQSSAKDVLTAPLHVRVEHGGELVLVGQFP